MSSDLDRIKDRIRQCLAVAENDASAQAEIDQAVRVAANLMRKHSIERDDVLQRDDGSIDASRVCYGRYAASGGSRNFNRWESELSGVICKLFGSVAVYHDAARAPQTREGAKVITDSGTWKMVCQFQFHGPDDDARAAAETFELMRIQIVAMAIKKHGGWAKGDGRSYCIGFVHGFAEAHTKEQQAIESYDEQSRQMIALSEQRQLAIKERSRTWLAEKHNITLRSRRTSTAPVSNGDSYGDGRRDGRAAEPLRKTAAPRIA